MWHGRHSALYQLEQKGIQVGILVCCCYHVNIMCLNYDLEAINFVVYVYQKAKLEHPRMEVRTSVVLFLICPH